MLSGKCNFFSKKSGTSGSYMYSTYIHTHTQLIEKGNSSKNATLKLGNSAYISTWYIRWLTLLLNEEGRKEKHWCLCHVCLISFFPSEFYSLAGALASTLSRPLTEQIKKTGWVLISKDIQPCEFWGPEVWGYQLQEAPISIPFKSLRKNFSPKGFLKSNF